MIIKKFHRFIYFIAVVTALFQGGNARAVQLKDHFDTFSTDNWTLFRKSKTPEVVLSNTLNGANRSIQFKTLGQLDFMASHEKFIDGEFMLRFKIDLPKKDKNMLFYLGFHNISPWGIDASWLLIHDGAVKFISRRQNGKTFLSPQIAALKSGQWYNLEFKNDSRNLSIFLDGKKIYTYSGEDNAIKRPICFFAGANSPQSATEPGILTLDDVEIKGKGADSLISPRPLTAEETTLLKNVKDTKMISLQNNQLNFNGKTKNYAWDFDGGLHWGKIDINSASASKSKTFVPCFAVKINRNVVYSHEFELIDLKLNADKSEANAVMLYRASSVEAVVSGRLNEDGALLMNFKLRNLAGKNQVLQPIFPIIGSLEFGDDLTGTEYFYPWSTGLLGHESGIFTAEYGNLVWMQVMFAYNPKTENGLYVFPLDSSGAVKGLVLSKKEKGQRPSVQHIQVAIPLEMPTVELPDNTLSLAYYYFKRELKPNASMSVPETIVNKYSGTWREPLKAYGDWVRTWYRPVNVPQWFRDSYIFVNHHPPAYFSKKTNEYTGHKKLAGGEDVVQWAFWQDYKEDPSGKKGSHMEMYQPGDFHYNQSRGGLSAFVDEINKVQEKDTAFTVYIDYRFCWEGSQIGKKYGKIWGAMFAPGKYTFYSHPDDFYCMCFYDQDTWANYLKDVCVRLVKDTPLKGIYLDELGIEMPCYNPQHEHYKQGRYPADWVGLSKSLTMVRDAMKAVQPETILWTEHAGSDWLTQFYDGSWTQAFYKGAYKFTEKYFDSNRLCYFRFMFPEFKLAEWGGSSRHMQRNFFNGMGWDLGGSSDQNMARVLAAILRENSDAIQTLKPEPLVTTSNPSLLANRFGTDSKIVYTLYNRAEQAVTGRISEPMPWQGHYVELLNDIEIGNKPEVTLEAGKVSAIALLPNLIDAKIVSGKVNVTVPANAGLELTAYPNHDIDWNKPRYGTKLNLTDGKTSFDLKGAFGGNCKKIILKATRNKRLVDQKILTVK